MNIAGINNIKFCSSEIKTTKRTSNTESNNKNAKILLSALAGLAVIGTSIILCKTKGKKLHTNSNEPQKQPKEIIEEIREKIDDSDFVSEKILSIKREELNKAVNKLKNLTDEMEALNLECENEVKIFKELVAKIKNGEKIDSLTVQAKQLKVKNLQLKFESLNNLYIKVKNEVEEIENEIKKHILD